MFDEYWETDRATAVTREDGQRWVRGQEVGPGLHDCSSGEPLPVDLGLQRL
jgi:hypothetical protein